MLQMDLSRAAAKRRAQHFAEDAADGLRTEANLALMEAASLLAKLENAGAGRLSIGAVKDALTDAFGDVQGAIDRTLDGEGLDTDRHQLDLSELEGV